jgi:hypothetical protein
MIADSSGVASFSIPDLPLARRQSMIGDAFDVLYHSTSIYETNGTALACDRRRARYALQHVPINLKYLLI